MAQRLRSLPALMIHDCTRRDALLALCSTVVTACAPAAGTGSSPEHPVAPSASPRGSLVDIESRVGGRVGVFAIDTGTGRTLAHREDERFAMCSTFKWALAAAVLGMVDRAETTLGERVPYGKADLFEEGAPVTTEHVAEGAMTIEALARAAVTVSDNTAANLLLAKVGGPAGLTRFFRASGDQVTRLDRNEPTLNLRDPGDIRDTTSPQAMVGLMRAILCGDVLSHPARERLLGWMQACETGRNRLRAGLPSGWMVGDKTGTGENGSCNDVAIALPPGRAPILVAAYLSDSQASDERLEAAHAGIARLVSARLG
jgi:beta-lactamase class A